MDRNNRRVKYLTGANTTFKAYGMNDEKKKKNKKKNTVQSAIRTVILALALIGLLALCVTYALTGSTRRASAACRASARRSAKMCRLSATA
ncbi:MAG: hypothetical protein ACLR07_13675 [Christensenellales bacterium]